jgi:hypothetical protein
VFLCVVLSCVGRGLGAELILHPRSPAESKKEIPTPEKGKRKKEKEEEEEFV